MKLSQMDQHRQGGAAPARGAGATLAEFVRRHRKALSLVIGLAVSAICLYFLIAILDFGAIRTAIDRADKQRLAIALALMSLVAVVRAWRILIWAGRSGKTPFASTALSNSLGYLALILIPARLGEFVRLELLSRAFVMGRSELLGFLAIERVVDMALIAAVTTISLLSLTANTSGLFTGQQLVYLDATVIGVFAAAFLVLLFLARSPSFSAAISRFGPTFARPWVEAFTSGLVKASRTSSLPILISLAVWLLEFAAVYMVVAAFSVDVPVSRILLLMGLMALSFAIPSGPAGLGVWQWVFVLLLPEAGASEAVVISACTQAVSIGAFMLTAALAAGVRALDRKVDTRLGP